jgi:60 kDa SS-A/Ro ribonucleoprotein
MRFNSPTSGASRTINHAGDVAYALSPELDLYSAVVTAALSDKFYDSGGDRRTRIRSLIGRCDLAFVAKLPV